MPKYNEEELDRMSGERQSLPRPKLEIPEIRFKAKEGIFKSSTRPENYQKGDAYIEKELGKSVNVVILRLKKFLSRDDFITDDYDSPEELIELKETSTDINGRWSIRTVETGTPKMLKEKHALRANAMLYVLYNGELMRLKVGGTSLFGDKHPNATLLYNYVAMFDRANGERAFKFLTQIEAYGPVKYPKGSAFIMSFSRLTPLSEAELDNVGDNLKKVDDYYKELEEYQNQFAKKEPVEVEPEIDVEQPEPKEELPIIQVEDDPYEGEFPSHTNEEINVDDIPF